MTYPSKEEVEADNHKQRKTYMKLYNISIIAMLAVAPIIPLITVVIYLVTSR